MKAERIADLYQDPGPFASVLVDVSKDSATGEQEFELRVREVLERLTRAGAPDKVVDALAETLREPPDVPAPASAVVIATERGVLLEDLVHTRIERATASWDALPDLSDWIAAEDAMIAFVLAIADHEGGEILTYGANGSVAATDEAVGGETRHEHKVRGGGLAHRRYQRTTENVWAQNAEAVAETLRSRISAGLRLILLAGEASARTQVREYLGSNPGVRVEELEHGGRSADGGDEALHDAVSNVLADYATTQRLTLVHDLKERLGRGEGAVTGIQDVAEAFVRGQVATLLLDADPTARQWLDPREHPGLALAGMPTNEPVRADIGLIAAAARTGADVVVAPTNTLYGASVAALLRWEGAES